MMIAFSHTGKLLSLFAGVSSTRDCFCTPQVSGVIPKISHAVLPLSVVFPACVPKHT
jgi:hypothetical protein